MTNDTITTHPPLTPKLIEGLRPREAEYEVPDPAAPGLRLRVTRKGVKCFRWYVTSIRRVVTIGRWSKSARPGFVTLAEARSWLEKLKEAHKAGRLDVVEAELRALRPRPERVRADAGEAVPAPITIRALAEDFLKNIETRRKQPAEVRRTIENELIPAIGDRPVAEVADSGQADRPFRPMPITRSGKAITRGVTPLGRSTSPASGPWSSPPSSS